jgi:hypothetical protein
LSLNQKEGKIGMTRKPPPQFASFTAAMLTRRTVIATVPSLFAVQLGVPAVEAATQGYYDPQSQLFIDEQTGKPAFLQTADTTIAYCQFQRSTGTTDNRDWEWYDAPDGFNED